MFELIAIIVFKASPKSIFIFHLSAKIVIFSFSTYIPDEMSDSVFLISFHIRTVQRGDHTELTRAAPSGRHKTDVELLSINMDIIFDILTFSISRV